LGLGRIAARCFAGADQAFSERCIFERGDLCGVGMLASLTLLVLDPNLFNASIPDRLSANHWLCRYPVQNDEIISIGTSLANP
jgi:hypothetical protein